MKILFVSSSILPYPGGSSVIMENLSRNFPKDELIIVGSRGLNPPKISRSQDGPVFKYFFSELSFFGRGARFFNWFRQFRFNALVRYLEKVVYENDVTHVIGVYPNSFYCLAAARVSVKTKLPFSTYFHNTYLENKAIKEPNAKRWQKEIFELSKNVFVMSRGMEEFYQMKYGGDKFKPLLHTFNEYPDESINTKCPGDKAKYKLVAFGNFNESNIDATKRFLNAIKNHDKYELSLYTHVPKLLLQKRGLNHSDYKHMGSVLPDEIHSELQNYDMCILTHGFKGGYGEVEYQTIFPTRTIQMLLSGKPIIAHAPKNSFLSAFIKSTECAFLIEEEHVEKIIDALNKVAGDISLQEQLVTNAKKAAAQFYGPNVARQLKKSLHETSVQK